MGIQYRSGIYLEDKLRLEEVKRILKEYNKGFSEVFKIEVSYWRIIVREKNITKIIWKKIPEAIAI